MVWTAWTGLDRLDRPGLACMVWTAWSNMNNSYAQHNERDLDKNNNQVVEMYNGFTQEPFLSSPVVPS
jgi:hypothetical protein